MKETIGSLTGRVARRLARIRHAIGITSAGFSTDLSADLAVGSSKNEATRPKRKAVLKQTPIPATQRGLSYQQKVASSFDQRWGLIKEAIPVDSGSLLDIGSNLGDFTARAAQSGLWSVGIEIDKKLHETALLRHSETKGCAFMMGPVDQSVIAQIPTFDVILLLSVHHHWHHDFGPDAARDMLKQLLRKTRRVLIFEGASRNERFRSEPPGFVDNDEESVTSYYLEYLANAAGSSAKIDRLGKARCVGEREPFRWIFGVYP